MKNKEKEVLKKTVIRSSLLLISIFSLIFGILITIEGITNNKKEKEELISYESNGNIDYQISLKENDFYNIENTNYKNIIGKYIDNINLRFNYEFSASNLLNSEVKYSLKLYLVSEYTANNKKEEIWKQEYELIPETEELNINSGIVTISKDITFNYDEYNEIAKKVRSESGVLTDSYIKVEFIVNNKLELIEKDYSIGEISMDTYLTLEEISSYLLLCINSNYIEKPQNPSIISLANFIAGKTRTGEFLKDNNIITNEQLSESINVDNQAKSNRKFGQILTDMGFVDKSYMENLFNFKEDSKKRFIADYNEIPESIQQYSKKEDKYKKEIEDLQLENKKLKKQLNQLLLLVKSNDE